MGATGSPVRQKGGDMFRYITPLLLLGACVGSPPVNSAWRDAVPAVSVFVVAHQDDWQLFMSPVAFHAMDEPGEKAVFIHVTAGDAGRGVTGEPVPYYKAREEGALRAVRFMANAGDKPGLGAPMEWSAAERAGHLVQRVVYANAVVYFLRLPDGRGLEGTGYEGTGFQSLQRLMSGEIQTIEAIDGSARYGGWADLQNTLRDIIETEREAGKALSIHITEPDPAFNPTEHSDHRHTALAVQGLLPRFPCAAVYRYDTYDIRNRPMNLEGDDLLINVGIWGATTSGLADNHAPSTWEPGHTQWLGRLYYRSTPAEGACD